MLRQAIGVVLCVLIASSIGLAQEEKDVEGSRDHPSLRACQATYISSYDVKDFDTYASPHLSGQDANREGKVTPRPIHRQDRCQAGKHGADSPQLRECGKKGSGARFLRARGG